MKNRMPRLLVEIVVKKALKSIKQSPERGVRNLIDMALQFSDGRFQKNFFTIAQTMLQNENSAYYELIRDVITHVDTEKLYTFGINIGYNSCTVGAQRIRENEKVLGCNIPWTICVEIDSQLFEKYQQKYDDLIFEGKSLGIDTWMFFVPDQPSKTFSLIEKYPDSAFCVFCDAMDITITFLKEATILKNLMVVIRYDENATDVCAELCANKMLYSIWYQYGQKDTEIIINGDLFRDAQQLSPIFTVLMPEKKCPSEVRQVIYSTVKQTRLDQSYSTIVWDLQGDNCLVDTIISEDACPVYFNKDGNICDWEKTFENGHHNLFQSSITDILLNACLKTK
ncbi:MAG: hypothetical protein GX217_08170 [Clostridiaceae bacterium]|nr:hypothetical protein [Clostridiaceae bacterium]